MHASALYLPLRNRWIVPRTRAVDTPARVTRMKTMDASPSNVVFVVFDLETTGLSPASDSIAQIGCVLLDATMATVDTFCSTVRPANGRLPPPFVMQAMRCSPADLATANTFCDVGVEFLDFLARGIPSNKRGILVAHNGARFDWPFLRKALREAKLDLPSNVREMADTMDMARSTRNSGVAMYPNLKLGTLYSTLVGGTFEGAHSALADAHALAMVLCAPVMWDCVMAHSRMLTH